VSHRRGRNRKRQNAPALRLGRAAFGGTFPDLFSFALPAVVRIWWYATGTTRSLLPDAHGPQHFQFVWQTHRCSLSPLVFAAIFAWLFLHRPILETS